MSPSATRVQHLRDRLATSLFLLPTLFVIGALGLAWAMLWLDSRIDHRADLPFVLDSTVASSRTVLQVVAGATIAFAGVAFSISMLTVQQAAAQHSPRVIETIFRDPFNRRVMGLVVGTFTFSLVVLRSVRSAIDAGGEPVVPLLSVTVSLALGIVTILGVVAFIDHNAHAMNIGNILDRIDRAATERFRIAWRSAERSDPGPPIAPPARPGHVIRAESGGWVQHVDLDRIARCAPAGSTVWLHTYPGRYVVTGTALVSLASAPDEPEGLAGAVHGAIGLGAERSSQQDVLLGLRQLADIALRALSPGVNDPTTAQDAIYHAANVLACALQREPPPALHVVDDRRVVVLARPRPEDLVRLAYEEIRRSAASHPAVARYLIDALADLDASLKAGGRDDRARLAADEARAVVRACEAAALPPDDHETVRHAFERRFDAAGAGG